MRQFTDGDRLFGNEATAGLKDAPEGSLVISGTGVTQASSTTVDVASGTITLDESSTSVSANTGVDLSPTPSSGNVRYDVITRDSNGNVVVTTGTEGSKGSDVGAPDRPAGHVLLATVRLLDSGIDAVFDGRSLLNFTPNAGVVGLQNFGDTDAFTGYPLVPDSDVTVPSVVVDPFTDEAYGARASAQILSRAETVTVSRLWLPSYTTASDSGMTVTFSSGRARLVAGSGSGGNIGAFRSDESVTQSAPPNVGTIDIRFSDVSRSSGGDRVLWGFTEQSASMGWRAGGAGIFILSEGPNDNRFRVVDSGGTAHDTSITINWSNNHDLRVTYDGSTAKGVVDGSEVASDSTNPDDSALYAPGAQVEETATGDTTTTEIEQLEVA